MEITVWVDAWQMQCCGEPFAVKDEVSWKLRGPDREWLAKVLGTDLACTVDYGEEHHGGVGDDVAATVRTVTSIRAVHCRYAPPPGKAERGLVPVAGTGTVSVVHSADGWTPDRGPLRFVGYLVRL